MNIHEFDALRAGDRVENPMSHSVGEVTERTAAGVRVKWGGGGVPFFYPILGTAWFHWTKTEAQEWNAANCEHGVAMDIFCELCEPAK